MNEPSTPTPELEREPSPTLSEPRDPEPTPMSQAAESTRPDGRSWRALAADRRMLMLAVTLGCLAMLLWGRLLLRSVPRTAVADPESKLAAGVGDLSGSNGLEALAEAFAASSEADRGPEVLVPAYPPLQRDLFAFDAAAFEAERVAAGNPDESAKSSADPADEMQRKAEREAQLRPAVRRLKLQSTMLGTRPRCLINGLLLEVGQRIDGFRIERIGSREVTVSRDGLTFVLEM